MAIDLDQIKAGGIVFKKGKDESEVKQRSTASFMPRKRKGETISGSAKMKAAYKARKMSRSKAKK